jgi:hypothetical protein
VVFVRDEGSVFEAPLDAVWEFVGSSHHARAHGHRRVRRRGYTERSGTYSWEQPFGGAAARFAMRWISFWPLGVAYQVTEGPFAGSRFFLIYEPRGERTAVSVVGEFVSPKLAPDAIKPAVLGFFALEFEQDSRGLAAFRTDGPKTGPADAKARPSRPKS